MRNLFLRTPNCGQLAHNPAFVSAPVEPTQGHMVPQKHQGFTGHPEPQRWRGEFRARNGAAQSPGLPRIWQEARFAGIRACGIALSDL